MFLFTECLDYYFEVILNNPLNSGDLTVDGVDVVIQLYETVFKSLVSWIFGFMSV